MAWPCLEIIWINLNVILIVDVSLPFRAAETVSKIGKNKLALSAHSVSDRNACKSKYIMIRDTTFIEVHSIEKSGLASADFAGNDR